MLKAEPRLQLHCSTAQCAACHAEVRVRSYRAIRRRRTQVPVDLLRVNVRLVKEVVNVRTDLEPGSLSQSRDPRQAEGLAQGEIDVVIAWRVQAVAVDSRQRRRPDGRKGWPLHIARRQEEFGAIAAVIRVNRLFECVVTGARARSRDNPCRAKLAVTAALVIHIIGIVERVPGKAGMQVPYSAESPPVQYLLLPAIAVEERRLPQAEKFEGIGHVIVRPS